MAWKRQMVREDSIGERARNKRKILNKEASHPYFFNGFCFNSNSSTEEKRKEVQLHTWGTPSLRSVIIKTPIKCCVTHEEF